MWSEFPFLHYVHKILFAPRRKPPPDDGHFSKKNPETTTSGGSRISQRRAPTPEGVLKYYLVYFCLKLHGNEKKWRGGVHISHDPRSATEYCLRTEDK